MHDRGIGVGAEGAAIGNRVAVEPDDGNAAGHAVGVGPFRGTQPWGAPGAIDEVGKTLVRVGERGEFAAQVFKFFPQVHGRSVRSGGSAATAGSGPPDQL